MRIRLTLARYFYLLYVQCQIVKVGIKIKKPQVLFSFISTSVTYFQMFFAFYDYYGSWKTVFLNIAPKSHLYFYIALRLRSKCTLVSLRYSAHRLHLWEIYRLSWYYLHGIYVSRKYHVFYRKFWANWWPLSTGIRTFANGYGVW